MGKRHSKTPCKDKVETDKEILNEKVQPANMIHDSAITSLDTDGDAILCGDDNGELLHFSIKDRSLVTQSKIHNRGITEVLLSHSSKNCFTASRDKNIKLTNYHSGSVLKTLSGHNLAVTGVASSEDFTKLVSGSRDCIVKLWDVQNGTCIKSNITNRNIVTDMKMVEDENVVIQCSEDKILKILDVRSVATVSTFPMRQYFQTCCAVNNFQILTGSTGCDGNGCDVALWDMRQLKIIGEMRGHSEKVTSCQFVVDRNQILRAVTVSLDCSVKLWDLQTKECVSTEFLGGSKELTCVGVNCDTRICIGAFSGVIHLRQYNELEKTFQEW